MTEQPPKTSLMPALNPKKQMPANFPTEGISLGPSPNLYMPQKTAFNPLADILAKSLSRINVSNPSQLGTFIKSERTAKGLTQQQLADLAGVGRRFIVECEAGKPRLEFAKVLQVAAAAGIDIFAIKR
jgi:y4mF family transcriptional regulator